MSVISMKQLLEAGVHFGHQTRRWNPKMAPYIYTERNGIHIIDLQKSVGMVDDAYNAISDIVSQGGTVLFVGTKKQAQDAIKVEALEAKQVEVIYVPDGEGRVDLVSLMQMLGQRQIDSVFVEGGAILNDSLFRLGLVNRVEVFVAPKVFGGAQAKSPVEGEGIAEVSEAKQYRLVDMKKIGQDVLLSYERQVD